MSCGSTPSVLPPTHHPAQGEGREFEAFEELPATIAGLLAMTATLPGDDRRTAGDDRHSTQR